jgi:carbamoyltransferase
MNILGISAFYHDSAAALVCDGKLVFASQEERFSRVKQDSGFPVRAVVAALDSTSISMNEIDLISWYENPDLKFNRSKKMVRDNWPHSFGTFKRAITTSVSSKRDISDAIQSILNWSGPVDFHLHHESHMASALFGRRGVGKVLALTLDAIGEFDTGTGFIYDFDHPEIPPTQVWRMEYPNSLGMIYSAVTQLLGFDVNEGEYKVMGLASYGEPIYLQDLHLLLKAKDSTRLHPKFKRNYTIWGDDEICYGIQLLQLFKISSVRNLSFSDKANIASSLQRFLEDVVLDICRELISIYHPKSLVMAGGVALNCTLNSKIARTLGIPVDVQPAAGDAGAAVGAALFSAYKHGEMKSARLPHHYEVFLGANVGTELELKSFKEHVGRRYRVQELATEYVSDLLSIGKVIGVCRGRAEFGPRALGARCILASPLTPEMKNHLNRAIKFREEFRPFAPVIREIDYEKYFEKLPGNSAKHMLFTVKSLQPEKVPAVTHVDGSSRVQSLSQGENYFLWDLLTSFGRRTGVPVLTLTSFNLKGEPMVQNAWDALKTFESSGMDALIVENMIILK